MLCVRCGGDGHLEAPDDGGLTTYVSDSGFDACLLCFTCMRTALLCSDSVSSDSCTVTALDASGRLRIRMFGRRATVEKEIKREWTRLTLLSPPFVNFMLWDRTEEQQRGSVHLHSLVWQTPLPSVVVSDSAPAALPISDEHSLASSAMLRSYFAGYRTRGEPTPQTKHRRGGETNGTRKTTQEDLA